MFDLQSPRCVLERRPLKSDAARGLDATERIDPVSTSRAVVYSFLHFRMSGRSIRRSSRLGRRLVWIHAELAALAGKRARPIRPAAELVNSLSHELARSLESPSVPS